MENHDERLKQLNDALEAKTYICSSGGTLHTFPPVLKDAAYKVNGIGLIICRSGGFDFRLDGKDYKAKPGDTLFVPEYSSLEVTKEEEGLEVCVLIYQVEPIRDILGNLVLSMYPYSQLSAEPCYVWKTGEEQEVVHYMRLLESTLPLEDSLFNQHERKLLLLALTHRLCSIYSRKVAAQQNGVGHKHEVFMKLIELIDRYFMQERGVEFYADKLCLSPKYLSALSKSVSGYTVQELVFKAIMRKSMSLLNNTQMTVQEISDMLNFPNASYFGTFFRKQMGMSPQQYRNNLKTQP